MFAHDKLDHLLEAANTRTAAQGASTVGRGGEDSESRVFCPGVCGMKAVDRGAVYEVRPESAAGDSSSVSNQSLTHKLRSTKTTDHQSIDDTMPCLS